MNRRNWLDLSRKLVDRFDMDYTVGSMQTSLGQAALSYWGEGVLQTTKYPTPFQISQSGISLGGSVGTGIAIDPNGQITEISSSPDSPITFTCAAADPTNPRWDLLVLSYRMVGDTAVPKPSDPISTINLNLHDDFQLSVVKGTASGSPAYPAKLSGQIILAGLRIPAAATLGTQIVVDLGIRELAMQRIFENPSIIHEVPVGPIPGSSFTLSKAPINGSSLIVIVDGRVLPNSEWTLTTNVVTVLSALAAGQSIDCWYIYDNPSSLNPLSGFSEVPANAGDNKTFNLSGRPGNRDSVLVFIDGAPLATSEFSLVQGVSGDQIILASAISLGQDVYVFYLVNPASIGMGGGGGGGGFVTGASNLGSGQGIFSTLAGSILEFLSLVPGANITIVPDGSGGLVISAPGGGGGSREVHGDSQAPISINPASGIVATSAADQVWWVVPSSGSGQVLVTATPPISAGGRNSTSGIGDRITINSPAAANYLRIPNVSGTDSDGDVDMGPYSQSIQYEWGGAIGWFENTRRV